MNIGITLPDESMRRLRAYAEANGDRSIMTSWIVSTLVREINALEPVKVTAPHGTSTRVEYVNSREGPTGL